MASGITCQMCGIEAPTRKIEFRQNIGMLFTRKYRTVKGSLCKQCIHRSFWKMTGTTLFLGPWGTISLLVSPVFIVNNIVWYVGSLGMPSVPPDARVPVLDQQAITRLGAHSASIFTRLARGEDLADVARDIARKTGATPGQVVKFVSTASQGNRAHPSTGGFPVQTVKPAESLPPIPLEPSPHPELDEPDQISAD